MSLAGLRSLHELLVVYSSNGGNADTNTKNISSAAVPKNRMHQEEVKWINKNDTSAENEIWTCTWTVWIRIATIATEVSDRPNDQTPLTNDGSTYDNTTDELRRRRDYQQSLQYKQQFLTALLQIFPLIFTHIKTR